MSEDRPIVEGEEILTRDASSGRIHRRVLLASGTVLTYEGCNLDDAGAYEIVGRDAIENAEHGQLCENDFPDISALS